MQFCSQKFFLFFVVIFALYWAMPWHRLRVNLLLVASFYFYASWNKSLALLICITALLDYLLALGIEHSTVNWRRKLLLGINLFVNLGLLCYFKYTNFFLVSLNEALTAAGMPTWFHTLKILLPVGISFYTFEAINYMVDVYRRRIPAQRNLGDFMLFILFFPHLIAGPIVRARDFLPQIERPKHWSWARMYLGTGYVLMGLVKKLAIADRMAEYVDPVFSYPSAYRASAIIFAAIAYSVQIYCDFSGYTDMAIGTAHMLGYKLARNFNMPYLAANIADFWRRWHISLSNWLRDYLFIPLGGSRGTRWQTTRNLLITMTLGGMWHGASWTFVFWGVLHGSFLVVHRGFRDYCKGRPLLEWFLRSVPGTLLCMLLTFICVAVGWVFFRATTFATALTMLHRVVAWSPGLNTPMPRMSLLWTLGFIWVCHGVACWVPWRKLWRVPAPIQGFGYAAALVLAQVLAPDAGKAFIYWKF
ncbi:MAG TPA: MBOAT family O-acyltransferase [Gemmataceae bacterium]|nr:MBOAT family O-acyltransferase [Gemmataceae bacterium]